MIKSRWLGCLFWHGWLPLLSVVNGGSPWAESAAEGARILLECSLGSYSSRMLLEWDVPDEFERDDFARRLPVDPNVWTDGSNVLDEVSVASSAGSGTYAHVSGRTWRHRRWEHLDEMGPVRDVIVDSCTGAFVRYLDLCRQC